MPFGAKDFCEGGLSSRSQISCIGRGVYRVAIDGAQSLNGTGITASAPNLHLKSGAVRNARNNGSSIHAWHNR